MLRVESLSKSYGEKRILDRVSFALGAGAFALQGANGIGKSTLLSLLAGAEQADGGDIWIDGRNLREEPRPARRLLSYAPDESPAYPFMTGRELLDFVAMIKKARVADVALGLVQGFALGAFLDTRFSDLSLGSQKKFVLCAAWIGEARVMLLDEPSNGLDLAARDLLARMFRAEAPSRTIVFASHDAEFVETAGAAIIALETLLTNRAA